MKEWEASTLYFALSCIFQAKLNPRSLYLVQYFPRKPVLDLLLRAKSWQVSEFTAFPVLCRATWVFPLLWKPVQDHEGSPTWQPRRDLLTQVSIHHVSVDEKQFKLSVSYIWLWDLEWLTPCLNLHLTMGRNKAEPLQGSFLNENKRKRDSNTIKCNSKKERWT